MRRSTRRVTGTPIPARVSKRNSLLLSRAADVALVAAVEDLIIVQRHLTLALIMRRQRIRPWPHTADNVARHEAGVRPHTVTDASVLPKRQRAHRVGTHLRTGLRLHQRTAHRTRRRGGGCAPFRGRAFYPITGMALRQRCRGGSPGECPPPLPYTVPKRETRPHWKISMHVARRAVLNYTVLCIYGSAPLEN